MIKADTESLGLSPSAVATLAGARGTWVGAPTGAVGPAMRELFDVGLIGEAGGLTRMGSILAEKLRRRLEEELLG